MHKRTHEIESPDNTSHTNTTNTNTTKSSSSSSAERMADGGGGREAANGGGGDDASGNGGGGGEGLPLLEEDMEARIKRSEARAERSRKRGSLGMELVRGWEGALAVLGSVLCCAFVCCGVPPSIRGWPSLANHIRHNTTYHNIPQPERDCRRKIGCRLMNLGNSCYQNW